MLLLTLVSLLAATPDQAALDSLEVAGPSGENRFDLLSGGKVLAHEVKWRLAKPFPLAGLRVTTCEVTRAAFSFAVGFESVDSKNDTQRKAKKLELLLEDPREGTEATLTISLPAEAGVEDVCLAKLELLGAGGKPVTLTVPPRDLAIAEAVAACERANPRGVLGEPIGCTAGPAEIEVPGRELMRVEASSRSDGEGSFTNADYRLLDGASSTSVLTLRSRNSGDGPGEAHTEKLHLCRQKTNGVQVFEVSSTDASWDVDAKGDFSDKSTSTLTRYVWTGASFDGTTADKPCPSPLVPHPPSWLKRASASSQLVEKGLPQDFYAPSAAVDGLSETAWAEGVKGPGTGESLTLELSAPMALRTLRLQPGCGTSPSVWRQNERLKTLTITFADGTHETVELPDAKWGEWRRVELARTAPTASVKLTVDAVYPARFQDTCLTEVQLELR